MTGLRVAYALAVLTACWVPVAAGAEPSVAVLGALVLALVIDSALDACRRRGWRALGLLALVGDDSGRGAALALALVAFLGLILDLAVESEERR